MIRKKPYQVHRPRPAPPSRRTGMPSIVSRLGKLGRMRDVKTDTILTRFDSTRWRLSNRHWFSAPPNTGAYRGMTTMSLRGRSIPLLILTAADLRLRRCGRRYDWPASQEVSPHGADLDRPDRHQHHGI